jgi:xanthine/uracil/vitamin C permease (AzgA family)
MKKLEFMIGTAVLQFLYLIYLPIIEMITGIYTAPWLTFVGILVVSGLSYLYFKLGEE